MGIRFSRKARGTTVVALSATAAVLLPAPPQAQAVDTVTVISTAVSVAYEAYKSYRDGGLNLATATQRIINAINQAKTEIIHEIDLVSAGEVKTCARSAVIRLGDIRRMSRDTVQGFAGDTLVCVIAAQVKIEDLRDLPSVDQVGFALNAVGPIAMFAQVYAGFSESFTGVRTTLIAANQELIRRLNPSCHPTPLWGDAEPGGPVEVLLTCRAFDGTLGRDSVIIRARRGDPLPPFNYDRAKKSAMANSSWIIAKYSALPRLRT